MTEPKQKLLSDQIVDLYKPIIEKKHPDLISRWPIVSGYNGKIGDYKDWGIIILEHTGVTSFKNTSGINNITSAIVGFENITEQNKEIVRKRLEKHFKTDQSDSVFLLQKQSDGNYGISNELDIALKKHEFFMGITPMRIFLSHKGADKPLIREFKATLELLGFDPWLDEDAMAAERSIMKGFNDSCAAVFFVTPNFKDENYLSSEVDYAISEKRKKGDAFSIITLVFGDDQQEGIVPELLHRYVWKTPKNHLEALREILKALPVQTGDVFWRRV